MVWAHRVARHTPPRKVLSSPRRLGWVHSKGYTNFPTCKMRFSSFFFQRLASSQGVAIWDHSQMDLNRRIIALYCAISYTTWFFLVANHRDHFFAFENMSSKLPSGTRSPARPSQWIEKLVFDFDFVAFVLAAPPSDMRKSGRIHTHFTLEINFLI